MRDAERFATIEAENIELKARLAAVEGKLAPKLPPTAPPDDGVKVTFPRTCSIAQPTVEEFRKLLRIVKAAHPKLVPDFADRSTAIEFGNGFVGSFEIISNLRRTAALDKRSGDHWTLQASRMLDAVGSRTDVSIAAFWAAVCAAGDINYSVGEYASGYRVGLSYHEGAPASADAWRRVIETGQVRPAIHFDPQPRVARQSDVRIYGG
jgi:hypothetical protein